MIRTTGLASVRSFSKTKGLPGRGEVYLNLDVIATVKSRRVAHPSGWNYRSVRCPVLSRFVRRGGHQVTDHIPRRGENGGVMPGLRRFYGPVICILSIAVAIAACRTHSSKKPA
jgi:hypothetical protein